MFILALEGYFDEIGVTRFLGGRGRIGSGLCVMMGLVGFDSLGGKGSVERTLVYFFVSLSSSSEIFSRRASRDVVAMIADGVILG